MNLVRRNAYAKLNLTLDVKGRENGYHLLDSLAVTIGLCDRVVVKRRKDGLSSIVMHGMGSERIPPEENNALRAAEAFSREFGTCGVDVKVYKNIPIAAGLGGSSADTAAVIAGMGAMFHVEREKVTAFSEGFGSDTGYLLQGGLARLGGRGERVEPLPFRKMYFLVLVPNGGVETRACFEAFDLIGAACGRRTEEVCRLLRAGDLAWAAHGFGNDLYPAAKSLNAAVAEALNVARSFSPLGASMTGSGSAVFAVFETRELAEWAKSRCGGRFRAFTAESVDPKNEKMPRNPFALGGEGGEEDIWQKNG